MIPAFVGVILLDGLVSDLTKRLFQFQLSFWFVIRDKRELAGSLITG